MTYDNAQQVRELVQRHGFDQRQVRMKNTHHVTLEERVIGRDLTWTDSLSTVRRPQRG